MSFEQNPSVNPVPEASRRHQLQYNESNESVAQLAEAGGSSGPMNHINPPTQYVRTLDQDTAGDWTLVDSAAPSLSNSNGGCSSSVLVDDDDDGSSNHAHHQRQLPPLRQGDELTHDKLQLHTMMSNNDAINITERIWMQGSPRSVLAKKGTATRGSNDSIDLGSPWVPVGGSHELDICGIGSWADMPRPAHLPSLD